MLLVGAHAPVERAAEGSPEQGNGAGIPYVQMTEEDAQRVREIVQAPTYQREFTDLTFRGPRVLLEFLLDRLDITGALMRALRLSSYAFTRLGDHVYLGDDGRGGRAIYQFVHRAPGHRVWLWRAHTSGEWLLYGRGVLVLRLGEEETWGEPVVETTIQAYVKIENPFWETLSKAIMPVAGPRVEERLTRMFRTIQRVVAHLAEEPQDLYEKVAVQGALSPEDLLGLRSLILGPTPANGSGQESPEQDGRP